MERIWNFVFVLDRNVLTKMSQMSQAVVSYMYYKQAPGSSRMVGYSSPWLASYVYLDLSITTARYTQQATMNGSSIRHASYFCLGPSNARKQRF